MRVIHRDRGRVMILAPPSIKINLKIRGNFGPFFWEGNSVWFGPEISHQLLILNPTPNPCDGLHPGTLCARKRPKIPKQNPGIGKESTEIEHDVSECLKNFCPKCIFKKSQNILHISGCRVSFATNFYRTPKYLVQSRKKCSCNVVTGVPAPKPGSSCNQSQPFFHSSLKECLSTF